MHDKAHHLALLDVVECDHTDEATRIFGAALLNFVQHFLSCAGVEQRQLPHSPEVCFSGRVLIELNARKISLVDGVFQLLDHLAVCKGRQIGKSFVTTLFR